MKEHKIPEELRNYLQDEPRYDLIEVKYCDYEFDCEKGCDKSKQDKCQIAKFYQRYGLNWREIGI